MIGIESHNEIMSKRLLEDNIELGNALVDMYAICGKLEKAKKQSMIFQFEMWSLGCMLGVDLC